MFVFVDEAGDTGLKLDRGSSHYFTIALVVFSGDEEMHRCDRAIKALRTTLRKPVNFEFHFHNNNAKVRKAFLETVAQFGFVYYVFALNKKDPERLWGDVFKRKDTFYMTVSKFVFENARAHLDGAYVIIDKSGSRDFQASLSKYVRGIANSEGKRKTIRKFRAERSSQNNLLQLADYIASVCHRKAINKPDADEYHRMVSLKEIQFRKWPE